MSGSATSVGTQTCRSVGTTASRNLELLKSAWLVCWGLPRRLHHPSGQWRQPPCVRQEDSCEGHCSVRKEDRKSTRLNSSHLGISYAVFCLKKKKQYTITIQYLLIQTS